MKKIIFAGAFMVAGFTAAFAGSPKTETKATTESTVAPSETKTASGTAAFQYISGDVNSPSSYGTTEVEPDDLCDNSGSNRCAATFTVDAQGNRTGSPTTPVWTKK